MARRELVRCDAHDLAYDPSIHDGCTLCRKSRVPPPALPPRASEALKTAAMVCVMALWVAFVLGGAYAMKTRLLAMSKSRSKTPAGPLAKMPDAPRPRDFVRVPVQPPTELPFIKRPGTDPFGYPRDAVDKLGLLALLGAGRYETLTAYLEQLEHDSESDFHKEIWVADAFESFATADPNVDTAIEDWVSASPGSFAPLLSRATHRISLAWYYRGHEFLNKTDGDRKAKFDEIMRTVDPDIELALQLEPKLVYARQLRLEIDGGGVTKLAKRKALDEALSICPACFRVRSFYLSRLAPRWGGSYAAMDQFALDAQKDAAKNPLLKALLGYADDDRCLAYLHDEKYAAALEACDHAIAAADYQRFQFSRMYALKDMKRFDEALAAVERAAELAPLNDEYLAWRGRLRITAGRLSEGTQDLRTALALDPTSEKNGPVVDSSIALLIRASYDRSQTNDFQGSLDALNLALLLSPGNQDALSRKAFAERRIADEKVAAPLERAALSADADFDAVKKLDDELVKTGQFPRIVKAWDEYIAAHPDDARAYLERGGARLHAGDTDGALSDLLRSCNAGLQRGCEGVQFVRARMH
ncbi:MAG TPA: tetratricopeptide repeat protein [Polyangiaceae bacterium]|nr:tetratricopeptide repeat protein [Polyangiaceae bacterium]